MNNTVALDIFEGPFDFLVHLIQKKEIDPSRVSLVEIIEQYLSRESEYSLDSGAEFIATAASLLLLKSQFLLPKSNSNSIQEEALDLKFDMIHQLLDYCHVKQAAQEFHRLEQQQSRFYPRRQCAPPAPQKKLGIEHLSLEDLVSVFRQALSRTKATPEIIQDEEWKVSDRIRWLKDFFQKKEEILLSTLFSEAKCKLELIVTFLAILELMKTGDILVVKETSEIYKLVKNGYGTRSN